MNIQSVAGSSLSSTVSAGTTPASSPGIDTDHDNDNDGGRSEVHRASGEHHKPRPLRQAIFQTLKQLGLIPAKPTAAPGTTATTPTDGNNHGDDAKRGTSTDGGQSARRAFHVFLHDLFQTLRESSATTQAPPTSQGGDHEQGTQKTYGNLDTALQNLVQGLGSGAPQPGSSLDRLNTDFQNLVQTLNGNTSGTPGAGASSPPTLQTFLQTLAQNLTGQQASSGGTVSPVGNLISTSA